MAKLVDAPDLGSGVLRRVGSSPIRRTNIKRGTFFMCPLFGFYALMHYVAHPIYYVSKSDFGGSYVLGRCFDIAFDLFMCRAFLY